MATDKILHLTVGYVAYADLEAKGDALKQDVARAFARAAKVHLGIHNEECVHTCFEPVQPRNLYIGTRDAEDCESGGAGRDPIVRVRVDMPTGYTLATKDAFAEAVTTSVAKLLGALKADVRLELVQPMPRNVYQGGLRIDAAKPKKPTKSGPR